VTIRKKPSKEHEKKKESRDAALMKGTEDLLALGVDLEALEPSDDSVAVLSGLRPPSPEAERAMACWLGFAEIEKSAELLAKMELEARDKELKKEIRRSLFRLEQRGVAAARRALDTAAPPVLSREQDRGYLSHVDGRGDQVIWYVRPERSGDYYILSGVVNDRKGLLEADAGRVARPGLRDLLEGTRRRFSIRLVPGDPLWCDLVVHEAYRKSDAQRRNPGVARFPSYRMEISHRVPERVPCPVHAHFGALPSEERERLVESSARLLDEPEMAGWILDADWIAPHLPALLEISESPLVLNRFQKEERREKALQEALSAILSGEAAEIYRRRMESASYFFLQDGREEPARRALAVHLALADLAGPPEAIPFLRALATKSLAAAEEAHRQRQAEEKRSSLILKPGER
jgi:hypothetical protein